MIVLTDSVPMMMGFEKRGMIAIPVDGHGRSGKHVSSVLNGSSVDPEQNRCSSDRSRKQTNHFSLSIPCSNAVDEGKV